MAFCDWLSRTTGQRCSLPTEAQWEYACRAGTATPLWFGDLTANFAPFANLADASLRGGLNTVRPWIPAIETVNDGATITRNVGAGQPNPWGLYDMHGNAAEWTRSLYVKLSVPRRRRTQRRHRPPTEQLLASAWSAAVRSGIARTAPPSSVRRSYEPWQRVFDVGFRIIVETETAQLTAVP